MDIINLFDYATLKWIWWLFIGALLIGFAIMDGHDMGIGTLLPQQQPYSVYAGLYGAFWADVFEALGFFHAVTNFSATTFTCSAVIPGL